DDHGRVVSVRYRVTEAREMLERVSDSPFGQRIGERAHCEGDPAWRAAECSLLLGHEAVSTRYIRYWREIDVDAGRPKKRSRCGPLRRRGGRSWHSRGGGRRRPD